MAAGNSNQEHLRQARDVSRSVVELIHRAGGGHFGGALSLVDILLVVWRDFLNLDRDSARDRFVLSKGHGVAALYCVLVELGLWSSARLEGFGRDPAALAAHPEFDADALMDFSTGSLGQGLSAALGMAVVLRSEERRAWVVLGDGECQEGQVWEAAMLAARLGAGNLVAIVDCNDHQEWGFRVAGKATPPIVAMADKWRAFGWRVEEADGHDPADLRRALCRAGDGNVPLAVLARTIKGHGIAGVAADPDRFHCTTLSEREYREILG